MLAPRTASRSGRSPFGTPTKDIEHIMKTSELSRNYSRQFWISFKKIFWYRRRGRPFVMLMEVVWPAFLFTVVISIRQGSPAEKRPQCFYPPRAMPSAGAIEFLQSHVCNVNKRCMPHEGYKKGTLYGGLGGSAPSSPGGDSIPTIGFGSSSESSMVLPLIPKVLQLLGLLSDTISQPDVEMFLTDGPPKKVQQFLKDKEKVKDILVDEKIVPENLIDNLLEAEIITSSSSDDGAASRLLDVKAILCDPVKLNQTLKLPISNMAEIRQMSLELCNFNHSLIPDLTSLLLGQLETNQVADQVLNGVQTLTKYTAEDVVDDISLILESLLKLQLLEPLIREFPFVGNLDDIIRNIKSIVVESKDKRSFSETVELVAPLVGNIINDEEYVRELVRLAQVIDRIASFISDQVGSTDYKYKLIDVLEDSLSYQIFIGNYVSDKQKRDLMYGPDILPARVRQLSDLMKLGETWYNLTCVTPGFSSIFAPTDNADHLAAIREVQNVTCALRDVDSLVQLSRLMDYRVIIQNIDNIQKRRMASVLDYFKLVGDVTAGTRSLIVLSRKTVKIFKDLVNGTSSLGAKFHRAFDIKFRIDDSKDYTIVDILDILYNIIVQAPEFRPLASAIHLGRQIVVTSNNNYAEFKSLLSDPGALFSILLGSTDLTEATIKSVFGQEIDTSALFDIQAGKSAAQVAEALCTGGQFLSLFDLNKASEWDVKEIRDKLCETDGIVQVAEGINLNTLIAEQVSNIVPGYMTYGGWWGETLRDINGVMDGVGAIIDLASGQRTFDGRVFLKLLYHTVAALGVQGRADLSKDVPTLFGLIKDRVVEPTYFADDIDILSKSLLHLSIFQRNVPIKLSLREHTKSPSSIISFLQEKGDLSYGVISNLLRSSLDFTLSYHIKDVEFDGEVCGPATLRQFLKLPDVSDDELSELTGKLCELPRAELLKLTETIVPQLDVGGLVKSLLDLSPTHLLKSSNLTKKETAYFVKNLGSLGNKLDRILSSINRTEDKTTSIFRMYGQTLCGDERAFDFGSYGAALLTPPSDGEDEEGEKKKREQVKKEPDWTPTQLREIADLNDTFCVDIYKTINGLSGVGPVLWTFLKPLTQGRVLYSPETPEATAIMKEAYWLFDSVKEISRLANTWVEFAEGLDKTNGDGKGSNKTDALADLQAALRMPIVSRAIEDATGVNGQELINNLPNNKSITKDDLDKVTAMAKTLMQVTRCIRFELIGYESEEAMETGAREYLNDNKLLAGVAFMNFPAKSKKRQATDVLHIPKHTEYKIRMNLDHTMVPKSLFDKVKKSAPDDDFLDNLRYLWGFLVIQDLVDQAVIKLQTGEETQVTKTYTQAFPYPCYDQDDFMVWSSFVIVIILLFSWLCMMAVGITSAVSEKENGIEDTMMVMGMRGSINRFAWFVNTLLGMIFLSAFVTALIIGGNLVRFSDPILVFIWLSTYSVSIVMLCYLVSALVHRSNLASLIGLLVYIVLCIPFIILHSMDVVFNLGFRDKVLMSLSVTSAFCFGANELLVTEKNGLGVTWDRAFVPTGGSFPFAWACIMSTVDSAIYGLIAWYISNKFPGVHGIPQPWYFPVSPYYWGIKKRQMNDVDVKLLDSSKSHKFQKQTDTMPGEKEPEDLPIGISLDKLSKVYKEGKKKAVDELSVNFYQGQITAFLGHNGAGKSTCIHMLTGLIPPTSGTAYIGGYNIKDGFEEIRTTLGYCPQHDVLFDYMTIKEHFLFYAQMKSNRSNSDIKEEVDRMLKLTGLSKFKDVPVNHLSGGQRRRVSVGCAFIGDSKFIILDEPTSGVDPAARRMIWDIIVKHKEGRTIILCTHHLDEADALGDRILVVHQGRLITSGSSLWLKNQFGSGYHLHISKATKPAFPLGSLTREPQIRKWSTQKLMDVVTVYVPDAQVTEEIGSEISIVLPTEPAKSNTFRELFHRLEAQHEDLLIDTYGVADSTLEEVFLKVTKWATENPGRPLQPKRIRAKVLKGTRESDQGDQGYDNNGYNSDDGSYRGNSSEYGSHTRVSGMRRGSITSSSCSSDPEYFGHEEDQRGKRRDKRNRGLGLAWRQFKALIIKRFHHYRRDLRSHVSQIVLPTVFVCIAMIGTSFNPSLGVVEPFYLDAALYGPQQKILFSMLNHTKFGEEMINSIKQKPGVGTLCMDLTFTTQDMRDFVERRTCHGREVDFEEVKVPAIRRLLYENPPNCSCRIGPWECPEGASGLPPPSLTTHAGDYVLDLTDHQFGIEQYSLRTFNQFKNAEPGGIYGGWTLDAIENYTKATVWFNSKGLHAIPSYYNAITNMALRANIKMRREKAYNSSLYVDDYPSDYGLTVHNYPFQADAWPISTNTLFMKFSDTGVSLTILIAYCFVPASYIIYVIKERISQEKRLQAITGVGTFLYWFNALLWDMMTYVSTLSLTVVITKAFDLHVYTYGENLQALAAILILFGWATIPMMYLLSRWFENPTSGYVAAFIINLAIGINCTACVFFLQTPIFNSRREIVAARDILTKAFLIFPQFCLGDALVKIAYNQIITDIFIRFNIHSYTSPFDKSLLFYHYLVLAVEGVLLFLFHLIIEFGLCDGSRKSSPRANYKEDGDVSRERQSVIYSRPEDNLVTIYKLSKYYRRRFRKILAVDNLCLGIPRGECFGLLGINGAGKTTTFKMITGEIPLSSGAVFLNGEIISEDVSNMNQNVGYCPQFDALDDFLTGEEMIYYYCRLRGIPERDISGICAELVSKFALEQYIKNTVRTYSAGNKRKLSTLLALIGDPDIVLLDEPTTGMDPGTRRLVWDNITSVVRDGRSVILTSHSMEECDALCTRLAIMVNGQFKCMGSSQHLKTKFGSGYTMTCRVEGDIANTKKVESFMRKTFKGSWVKDRHLNMLEFGIPARSNTLAALFGQIEIQKGRLKIENYSVTQTTLDNVFLNFARFQTDDRMLSNWSDDLREQYDSDPEASDLDTDDTIDTGSSSGGMPSSSGPPSYQHQRRSSIAPNPYNIPHISRSPEHPAAGNMGHSDDALVHSEDGDASSSATGSGYTVDTGSGRDPTTLSHTSSTYSLSERSEQSDATSFV